MRVEVKHKYVVLVVLQRGDQCQQLAAIGLVAVAKDDRRRRTQSGEKPAFATAHAGHVEGNVAGMTREILGIDLPAALRSEERRVGKEAVAGERAKDENE